MTQKQWIEFATLREELDFPTVLQHYGLAHSEDKTQLKINCPFHEDHSPSCSINMTRGIFKCFGCAAKGNILEFVILMEGGNPEDKEDIYNGAISAIEILGRTPEDFAKPSSKPKGKKPARKASNKVDAKPSKQSARKTADKPAQRASGDVESPTKKNAVLDLQLDLEHEHPFLIERGIEPELAERYGLGFCAGGIMKGRIAIPIHNINGELVAYVGRYANEHIPDKVDRYRFPKRFLKSLELYNLHRAITLEKRHLVLVEGYWSAIRLHEAGIPVVALMGTSVSQAQAQLVREAGFKFITQLLDGDDAGRTASKENAHILAQHVYVRTLELPDGEKPDTVSEGFMKQFR